MERWRDPKTAQIFATGTKIIKERRRELVSELLLKHYSYRQIRTEVMARLHLATYSMATVKKDVEALLEELQQTRIENTDLAVQLELEELEDLMHEARMAWEKSKEDYQKSKGKQTGLPIGQQAAGPNGVVVVKVEQSKEEVRQVGDPRYLEIINKLQQERRKLLGLYAPEKKVVATDLSFASFLMKTGRRKD